MFNFFLYKRKTAYDMRISDWSSDVCSSDLLCLADQPVGDVLLEVGLERAVVVHDLHATPTEHIGGPDEDRVTDLVGDLLGLVEIGRASCRERVCQYV